MARSSSPKHSGSGSQQSVPKPPTSCRAVHGKTAIARASTRNSVTNCSTAKSSTRSRKRRSSSKTGDSITTQCGHIHHWATNHRHPKQPSGLHKMGQRQHQQWQADRSCTNIPNGSPRGGRPTCCAFITKIDERTQIGSGDYYIPMVDPTRGIKPALNNSLWGKASRLLFSVEQHVHFSPEKIAMYHMNCNVPIAAAF